MSNDLLLASLETLRLRLCAETQLLTDAGMPAAQVDTDALILSMRPDGSWSDIDLACKNLKDWSASRHLYRLNNLAGAWLHDTSPKHRDEATLLALLRGLDHWYAQNPQNPNWWWNQIGAPQLLGEVLIRIKGACDRSYIDRAIPSFQCHRDPRLFTGQNLVWVAFVDIRHGILVDNPALVTTAFSSIAAEVRVLPDEEGLQPDMSFHQHGKLLYNGGYGKGFAYDIARLIAIAAGTRFAMPARVVNLFADFMLDGSRWMIRGRTFDPGTVGREIARVGHSADQYRSGLALLSRVEHARKAEVQASLDVSPSNGKSLVTGNKFFWRSDFVTHHRADFYASIRMPSNRILKADGAHCGGEGRVCHHMADGAFLVMRDGNEYRDIYPVWNWRQIPGATIVQDIGGFDERTLVRRGETAFSGGVSDGVLGCAAVDFSLGDLKARKAWFVFEHGIVALGAGISATSGPAVRTTINQCHWRGPAFLGEQTTPLDSGEFALTPDSTFWHDGFSYHLFDGAATLRLGTQSGAWSDVGVGSSDVQTLRVFNAGIDHGSSPSDATYAYAIMPAAKHEVASHAKLFTIVQNASYLQAVWHTRESRGHAVFYEPGEVTFPDGQRIAVDRRCILLYHPESDGGVTITVAQPEQLDGVVTFTLRGLRNCTMGVTLPRREYAGSSQTVMWRPNRDRGGLT